MIVRRRRHSGAPTAPGLSAAAAGTVLCLIAACTPTADEPPDRSGTPVPETSAEAPGETAPAAPETLAGFLGPAFDPHDPESAQAYYLEQEHRIQEAIETCMAAAGFEYVPVEHPAGEVALDEDAEAEMIGAEGFGITTSVGDGAGSETEADEEFRDPNAGIVAGLSEADRVAYRAALYGSAEDVESEREVDPSTGEEVPVITGFGSGCEGQAYQDQYGDQIAVFDELELDLAALDARIEADPRIVSLRRKWSECMTEAGFEFADRRQMLEEGVADLQLRLEEIVGPEAPSEPEPELSEDAATRLAALQREEISLAVADLECSRDHEAAYAEVSAEYEDGFIDANRDRLERLRSDG